MTRSGASRASEAATAVAELHAAIALPDTALAVFFASPEYDHESLATALNAQFAGVPLIGCTTAGEFGPLGYLQHSLSGFSLSRAAFQAQTHCFPDVADFSVGSAASPVHDMLAALTADGSPPAAADTFGFLMVDGLSMREEIVAAALSCALDDIQFFGGSAGDGLHFRKTCVFHDGRFHDSAALLALIRTTRPFKVFQTQHFDELAQALVVTDADPTQRLVREINGEVAALEYATAVGVAPETLSPEVFATHPVVVRIGGKPYVRSIQKANADGSLSFYCAIDVGVVLSVAKGGDIVANLAGSLAQVEADVGTPQLVIGCDCILRNLEIEQKAVRPQIANLMQAHHIVGFSTYGEQLNSVHMNQTFTGVAIG